MAAHLQGRIDGRVQTGALSSTASRPQPCTRLRAAQSRKQVGRRRTSHSVRCESSSSSSTIVSFGEALFGKAFRSCWFPSKTAPDTMYQSAVAARNHVLFQMSIAFISSIHVPMNMVLFAPADCLANQRGVPKEEVSSW